MADPVTVERRQLIDQMLPESRGVGPGLLEIRLILDHGLDKLERGPVDGPGHLDLAQRVTVGLRRTHDGSDPEPGAGPQLGPGMDDVQRHLVLGPQFAHKVVGGGQGVLAELGRVPGLHGFVHQHGATGRHHVGQDMRLDRWQIQIVACRIARIHETQEINASLVRRIQNLEPVCLCTSLIFSILSSSSSSSPPSIISFFFFSSFVVLYTCTFQGPPFQVGRRSAA